MTASTDDLQRALELTGELVASVRDDQWDAPTPCSEWTVRDLVNHLSAGGRRFAAALGGPEPDRSDGDPAASYRAAADALVAAFRQPGALDQLVTLPMGTMPGSVALQRRLVEALTHGWDLARATGRPFDPPDDLVAPALEFSHRRVSDAQASGLPFDPPRPAPPDAPPIDQLAALLGRPV